MLGMSLPFGRSLPIAVAAAILMAAPARAQTAGAPSRIRDAAVALDAVPDVGVPDNSEPPHVRAEEMDARSLIQDVADLSATARSLVDRLQQSDVVVYVRFRWFATVDIDGRIALLSSVPGRRYLVVELACPRIRFVQLVTLAHELHHAVEIAEAASVVDHRTLAAHYSRIGIKTSVGPNTEVFETFAARDTAAQVRRELHATTVRTSHEQH